MIHRLEIAYAIARHLNLYGWPCAYETASGEHIGVGVDVTEDGAWVSVRVGGKLMYSQLHNTFCTRSNAKAGEVDRLVNTRGYKAARHAIECLRATAEFRDEEGEDTDAIEAFLDALSTHDKTKA